MTDGYSLRYTVPYTTTELPTGGVLMESTGPAEAAWVPDPRPAPPELAEGFEPERYGTQAPLRSRTDWVSIQEKIGAAKMEELLAIFGGYPIDPSLP